MKQIYALLATFVMTCLLAAPAISQNSYLVRSGDILRIEVLEDESLNRDVLVRPDGRISVPFAGSVTAAGQTIEQIRATLTAQLAPNFAGSPNVFVSLETLRTPTGTSHIHIYAMGETEAPGMFEVRRGTTLLQALAEIGGFTRFAATKRLALHRRDRSGSTTVYNFNYDAIVSGTGRGASTVMADGDVIIIPQRRLFE